MAIQSITSAELWRDLGSQPAGAHNIAGEYKEWKDVWDRAISGEPGPGFPEGLRCTVEKDELRKTARVLLTAPSYGKNPVSVLHRSHSVLGGEFMEVSFDELDEEGQRARSLLYQIYQSGKHGFRYFDGPPPEGKREDLYLRLGDISKLAEVRFAVTHQQQQTEGTAAQDRPPAGSFLGRLLRRIINNS